MRSTYERCVWRAPRPVNMADCMNECRYCWKCVRIDIFLLHFKQYLHSFMQSARQTHRLYVLRMIVKLAYFETPSWKWGRQSLSRYLARMRSRYSDVLSYPWFCPVPRPLFCSAACIIQTAASFDSRNELSISISDTMFKKGEYSALYGL